jgi:hypothetical protein
MTLVAELRDSISGELLARAYDKREDMRDTRWEWTTSITKAQAAKRAIGVWAGAYARHSIARGTRTQLHDAKRSTFHTHPTPDFVLDKCCPLAEHSNFLHWRSRVRSILRRQLRNTIEGPSTARASDEKKREDCMAEAIPARCPDRPSMQKSSVNIGSCARSVAPITCALRLVYVRIAERLCLFAAQRVFPVLTSQRSQA